MIRERVKGHAPQLLEHIKHAAIIKVHVQAIGGGEYVKVTKTAIRQTLSRLSPTGIITFTYYPQDKLLYIG